MTDSKKRINVLVVDDSASVRKLLVDVLSSDPEINIIAAVADPILAMQRMKMQWPDVISLDIEMPRMDGLTFLRQIMAERPTPVVICSTLTEKGTDETLQALSGGAVDIITKPKLGIREIFHEQRTMLIDAIKGAARAKVSAITAPKAKPAAKLSADAVLAPPSRALNTTTEQIVAIGTSTGGTQALEQVLSVLPRVSPGIVVVQHMPEKFTTAFADRLNHVCEIEVREAHHGDRVTPGLALIAPGGRHMVLRRSGAQYFVDVIDGPLVSRHRPSVDVLFRSVAKAAGKNALGIIMTGMGDDGANGLLEMRESGAFTLAQDEASCVVFGMPNEAIKRGAANKVVSLKDIPAEIVRRLSL
ncbi:MAG: chemotaxis response regulator protein-glutamate methylesterase [Gammaproteobacteria bacterium]|nr:chemotaxis response regulator protein-glutamate methylesterase [Gammaproteobacteria bacterium]